MGVYVYLRVCMHVCVCVRACGVQEKTLDPLKVKLQMV